MHAKNTIDDLIFDILNKKALVTTGVTDGHQESLKLNKEQSVRISSAVEHSPSPRASRVSDVDKSI